MLTKVVYFLKLGLMTMKNTVRATITARTMIFCPFCPLNTELFFTAAPF